MNAKNVIGWVVGLAALGVESQSSYFSLVMMVEKL